MPRPFKIEFDTLPGHNPNTGATIMNAALSPYGWRSIGASRGGRFANRTSGTITAIYLKANNTGDTLDVTPDSGGRLFPTIWLKNDSTEAYFMDANVPVNPGSGSTVGVFWMRVPRNDEGDIARCDSGGTCPFTGQVFPRNPPDPGAGWRRIRADFQPLSGRWRQLMEACPSQYRDIRAYGESPDGQHILLLSDADVLVFDASTKSVSLLEIGLTEFSLVNHVSFQNGEFVLAANGTPVRKVSFGGTNKDFSLIGSAP